MAVRSAAMPPGYFVDSAQTLEPCPASREETTGEFTLSIRRDCSDSLSHLLGIAESLYPPRDMLLGMAFEYGYEVGSDSAGVPLWWCDGPGERRIPYAVTAGALRHYTRLTELFRVRNFRGAGTRPLFWSKLVYRAGIAPRVGIGARRASDPKVYVARLELAWSYDDGTFEQHIKALRTVAFTAGGAVLAVEGDGAAWEETFMSKNRGIRLLR